jgi:hypothetical protein
MERKLNCADDDQMGAEAGYLYTYSSVALAFSHLAKSRLQAPEEHPPFQLIIQELEMYFQDPILTKLKG